MATRGRTEKVSITLPSNLVREVREAVPQGEVSAFVTEAVQLYLAHRRQGVALNRGFGAWKSQAHPKLETTQDTVSYIRSIREAGRERLARPPDNDDK
jgi:Arc/MetJ-type ribon-helix-helix transcriptional regulator